MTGTQKMTEWGMSVNVEKPAVMERLRISGE
jgi:hypothetical protein